MFLGQKLGIGCDEASPNNSVILSLNEMEGVKGSINLMVLPCHQRYFLGAVDAGPLSFKEFVVHKVSTTETEDLPPFPAGDCELVAGK